MDLKIEDIFEVLQRAASWMKIDREELLKTVLSGVYHVDLTHERPGSRELWCIAELIKADARCGTPDVTTGNEIPWIGVPDERPYAFGGVLGDWLGIDDTPDGPDDDLDDDDDDLDEDELTFMARIVRMVRGATSGSSSPMWRCVTEEGERVNVFKHEKPERDTFHLFAESNYGQDMILMEVDDVLAWKAHPIRVHLLEENGWLTVVSVDQRPEGAEPDAETEEKPSLVQARREAIDWSHAWLVSDPVIFDTETTGTGGDAEIVKIAIIDRDGKTLLNQLVKPSEAGLNKLVEKDPQRGLSPEDIHGIRPEDLADAPSFPEVWPQVERIFAGKIVLAYNAEYDLRMLRLEQMRHDLPSTATWTTHCIMLEYARFAGEWDAVKADWRWHKLATAAGTMGQPIIEEHDPVNDCLMALSVLKAMAAWEMLTEAE
jgi:DNA polymerase-3 subunit epsilon